MNKQLVSRTRGGSGLTEKDLKSGTCQFIIMPVSTFHIPSINLNIRKYLISPLWSIPVCRSGTAFLNLLSSRFSPELQLPLSQEDSRMPNTADEGCELSSNSAHHRHELFESGRCAVGVKQCTLMYLLSILLHRSVLGPVKVCYFRLVWLDHCPRD